MALTINFFQETFIRIVTYLVNNKYVEKEELPIVSGPNTLDNQIYNNATNSGGGSYQKKFMFEDSPGLDPSDMNINMRDIEEVKHPNVDNAKPIPLKKIMEDEYDRVDNDMNST